MFRIISADRLDGLRGQLREARRSLSRALEDNAILRAKLGEGGKWVSPEQLPLGFKMKADHIVNLGGAIQRLPLTTYTPADVISAVWVEDKDIPPRWRPRKMEEGNDK